MNATVRRAVDLAVGRGPLDRLTGPTAWAVGALLLLPRFWLAQIFFVAGLTRVKSWDSQSFLFTEIHPLPFLPAAVAAPLTTAAELALPALLVFGLLGRPAAFGLLTMAATIEWIVARTPQGLENHIGNPVHYWWMLAALVLTVTGPGRVSLDHLLLRPRLTAQGGARHEFEGTAS